MNGMLRADRRAQGKIDWALIREDGKRVNVHWKQIDRSFAMEVADRFREGGASAISFEVEFDSNQGQASRIRRPGATWEAPEPGIGQPEPQRLTIPEPASEQPRSLPSPAPPPVPSRHLVALDRSPRGRSPSPERGDERPAPRPTGRQDGSVATPSGFHNPYNFIPTPPRRASGDAEGSGSRDVGLVRELGDRPPHGHHRFHPDLWTGRIGVTLTTVTPLLIPDAARLQQQTDGHKIYGVRRGPDGRPWLAPTSIKGVLRSAYEAVTNSRYGIFTGHCDRLGYRKGAREALRLIPARVERNASGQDELVLLMGDSHGLPTWVGGHWEPPGNLQYAAWLPLGLAATAEHGARVWAYLTLWRHEVRRFFFWSVERIDTSSAMPSYTPPMRRAPGRSQPVSGPAARAMWVQGWVCRNNQNIKGKHDERLFFTTNSTPRLIQIRPEDRKAWRELIDSYRSCHGEEERWNRKDNGRPVGPEAYIRERGAGAEDKPALSRHIYRDGRPHRLNRKNQHDDAVLDPETLCYAQITTDSAGKYAIESLYPVMIARELFERSPHSLLDSSLWPASSTRELSPADRVFGWVRQRASESGDTDGQATAWRGSLRIGPVRCGSEWAYAVEDFGEQGLALSILGQPKPEQVRFYGACDVVGSPLGVGTPKEKGYAAVDERGRAVGQGLRGRKVYPHHAGLPDRYWEAPQQANATDSIQSGGRTWFREYLRPDRERDGQNRSIRGWIRPRTTFSFWVEVRNLSPVELGALLWLLDLNRYEGGEEKHVYCHRFGGGKPLGFGSATLSIDWEETALALGGAPVRSDRDGPVGIDENAESAASPGIAEPVRSAEGWVDVYRTLGRRQPPSGDVMRTVLASAVQGFREAVTRFAGDEFPRAPFIAAFLQAARGYCDLPTHYPRCREAQADPSAAVPPSPKGELFRWFMENERGPKRSLPLLVNDPGLPYYRLPEGRGGGRR